MSIPKIIGVTGGIGSGKSMVCRICACLGIPVYNSDEMARSLYDRDPELLHLVVERFGAEILDQEGKLDRSALAARVFADKESLKDLNGLVHPAVKRDFQRWVNIHGLHPLLIKEAAILFESGANVHCDEVWLVTAPESLRVNRATRRDSVSEQEVRSRMQHQWTDEKKAKLADRIIVNDQKQLLIPQIWEALEPDLRDDQ